MSGEQQYDLGRFVKAQEAGGTYAQVVLELSRGRKTSHWMWFVFPQIAGLGRSTTARYYAIAALAEAEAYVAHDILGPRLLECAGLVAGHSDLTAEYIFGGIDALKLHSSMTLFMRSAPGEPIFAQVLQTLFSGVPDGATDRILGQATSPEPRARQ